MTERRAITTREVARVLGHAIEWFYKHRARLEGEGFPKPIPGLGLRWDSVAVEAWIGRGTATGASERDGGTADDRAETDGAAIEQRLAHRAAVLAGRFDNPRATQQHGPVTKGER